MSNLPQERRLREVWQFAADATDLPFGAPEIWLTAEDVLLRPPIGDEDFIFGLNERFGEKFDRLMDLANQYCERARDLVRLALVSPLGAENFAYVVGYLYRHAIELLLKHMIADEPDVRTLSPKEQKERIFAHSLVELWERARPSIDSFAEPDIMPVVARLLQELDELDDKAEGFRYPFRFNPKAPSIDETMLKLTKASFDNLIWVLEGIYRWLTCVDDQRHRARRATSSGFGP
jgi:hypothetical protein